MDPNTFYPTLPKINIQPRQTPLAPSPIKQGTQLSGLIDKIGGYLRPQRAFSEAQPYEQYAAPQRAVFDEFVKTQARPEFEMDVLNPFKERSANQAAAGGSMYSGNAPSVYQNRLRLTERPYYEQLEQMRNAYQGMIDEGYNRRIQSYYDSPSAFNNIGL